jgi:hypothetical protein
MNGAHIGQESHATGEVDASKVKTLISTGSESVPSARGDQRVARLSSEPP